MSQVPTRKRTRCKVLRRMRYAARRVLPSLSDKILTTRGALEGERKQVTVVFADVARFSTLAEQVDPESVHTIMNGCFDILTRQAHHYEGTINQFTGDGIMASVNQQRRITLLVNQAVVMVQLLRMPEYHDVLTRYASVALGLETPGLVGAFQGRIGFCRWSFGDFDQAIPILTHAARMCEAAGNAEDAGQAYNHLLWSHYLQANYAQVFAAKNAGKKRSGLSILTAKPPNSTNYKAMATSATSRQKTGGF